MHQMSTTGLACATLSVYPKFRTPQWRPYRAAMFIAMGLSSVWSVFHGAELFGYEQLDKQMGLSWMITEGVLYITGALLYAVCEPSGKEQQSLCLLCTLGSRPRTFKARSIRCAWQLSSDLPCLDFAGGRRASGWIGEGVRLSTSVDHL